VVVATPNSVGVYAKIAKQIDTELTVILA